jgi:hypothetical protein
MLPHHPARHAMAGTGRMDAFVGGQVMVKTLVHALIACALGVALGLLSDAAQ